MDKLDVNVVGKEISPMEDTASHMVGMYNLFTGKKEEIWEQ